MYEDLSPGGIRKRTYLHEGHGNGVESAVDLDEGVVGRERLELVRGRDEGQARQGGDLGGRLLGEALPRVEARADGRAAEGQLVQPRQRVLHPGYSVLHLGRVTCDGEKKEL